jgi:hypothetical protein
MERHAVETSGRTCTLDRGDKHALETREMTYFVMWFSRQAKETIWVVRWFVTNRHMLCCYAVIYCTYTVLHIFDKPHILIKLYSILFSIACVDYFSRNLATNKRNSDSLLCKVVVLYTVHKRHMRLRYIIEKNDIYPHLFHIHFE